MTPVTKFKDKKTAVTRVWKAIQNEPTQTQDVETEPAIPELDANVGEQAPDVAPAEEPATKTRRKRPQAKRASKLLAKPARPVA